MTTEVSSPNSTQQTSPEELQAIVQALQGVRFGAVTIIVQDGVVIQIERTEKRRLRHRATSGPVSSTT